MLQKIKFIIISLLAFFSLTVMAQNSAKIRGTVSDSLSDEPLIGANVFIVGTSQGSSTDFDGHFVINSVTPGKIKIKVSYLGYQTYEEIVDVMPNTILELTYSLVPEIIEGEEVVITAQREGQIAAINQQLTSNTIKNVVSSDKIEQLPEANAAEAVGRLPGVSLERNGGEGSKVIIRGLAPKYNRVQIDGVDMAATDADDRSSDLSMISPYMLESIEVTKAAMANQNANQLGGTVNFILKGAPNKPSSYEVIAEGGYNGLRNEYRDYQIVGRHSQRLFDDKFGISFLFDIENRNRSSNSASSDYIYQQEDSVTAINSLTVSDVTRNLQRYNTSLVLDYKSENTDIKFSNMFSRADRENVSRSESTSGLFGSSSRNQNLTSTESTSDVLMSRFMLTQNIEDVVLDFGLSYTYSRNKVPEELSYGGTEPSPLTGAIPYNTKPENVPNYMKNEPSKITLGQMSDSDSKTKEDEFAANIDIDWKTKISDDITLDLKGGGQYRYKTREYDYNTIYLNVSRDPSNIVNKAILEKWPWMGSYVTTNSFPYEPFIDHNYDPGDFLEGKYKLERIPQLQLGKDLIHYLEDYLGVQWEGASTPQRFVPNFETSKRFDYDGTEEYYATYIMPIFNFFDKVTFIPGIRYEHVKTDYNGIHGDGAKNFPSVNYLYKDKNVIRKNDFFLPMIHVRYKPTDWFDIRLSYTQTLSRPSYYEFLPTWHISAAPMSIEYRNSSLKPAKSQNWDLYFSFYGNKTGLFTIGAFAKQIDDLVFYDNRIILSDSMAIADYNLTEEETGYSPSAFKNKPISSFVNNPNQSKVWGIEVEWQSNLWYLPGLLSNIVFGINYTYTYSEVQYPRTVPIYEFVSSPFGQVKKIVGNEEVPYTAPLIEQPKHVLNITLGYDYKDFSIRSSVQLKSKIFSSTNWRPELRGYSEQFVIYDLALNQKLPIEGLSVYGNIKNISKAPEVDVNNGTGYMSHIEYYSTYANMGVRYKF